jgi:hypothetical protein
MPKWVLNAMRHEILALKIDTSLKKCCLITHVAIKIQMDENVQAYYVYIICAICHM